VKRSCGRRHGQLRWVVGGIGAGMDKRTVGGWLVAALIVGAFVGPASGASRQRAAEAAPVARDGPFGIAMGESLSDLGPVEKNDVGYKVQSPPRPSPDIYLVSVQAFPTTGVCTIFAATKPDDNDPGAFNAKGLIDRLADALQSKYGPASKIDRCDAAAGICSQYLTQAIEAGTAHYAYVWSFKGARSDHIGQIVAAVQGVGDVSTSVMIAYVSDNADCETAKNAAGASAF
jgi:hypothetical protein